MILVIGGAFAGKSDYVRNNMHIDDILPHDAEYNELKTARAIKDIHLYIKEIMKNGDDAYRAVDRLTNDNPDAVIISDEIGYGIVPVDKFEREYRETVGRISCYLAEKAERVIRVVCGIGTVIK